MAGIDDIGRIVMVLDATRAAASVILNGLEDLGGGITQQAKAELINYCAAIRDEEQCGATVACVAAMRELGSGTLGERLQLCERQVSRLPC
ncbi:hypothetical protein PQR71_24670 [Paraburkholderia fungorum]|jgi:hypothetical protein|uniref:hypothetical protein n=1 Tax=Paraburkholderia fungorum TaxID=134537 RepID=UPI0038B6B498